MNQKPRRYRASDFPTTPVRESSHAHPRPMARGSLLTGLLLGLMFLAVGAYLLMAVTRSNGQTSYWRVLVAILMGKHLFDVLEVEIQNTITS